MNRLLKSELYKFKRNNTFRICVLFLVLIVPFSIYVLWKDTNIPLNGAEILLSRMGDNIPVVVISIFISTFVAEEFYTGRIRLILPHSESKTRFYLSKLVVCSIAMVFANIIELGLYSLIATIGWGFDPNKVFNLPGFIMFITLQIIVLCAYSSIFVFTAMLTGSYGKSLAINIFILLLAPNILGFIDNIFGTQIYNCWPGKCSVLAGSFQTPFSTCIQVFLSSFAVILITTALGCKIFSYRDI